MPVSFRWHHDRSRPPLKGPLSVQFIQAMVRMLLCCPWSIFLCFYLSLSTTHTHTHTHTPIHRTCQTGAGRLHYPPVRSVLALTGSSTGHPTIDTADSTAFVCVGVRLELAGKTIMMNQMMSKAQSILPWLSPHPCNLICLSLEHTHKVKAGFEGTDSSWTHRDKRLQSFQRCLDISFRKYLVLEEDNFIALGRCVGLPWQPEVLVCSVTYFTLLWTRVFVSVASLHIKDQLKVALQWGMSVLK